MLLCTDLKSYGGFVTSHVIAHPTNVVRCGLAVAPVTDFRYHSECHIILELSSRDSVTGQKQ